MPPKPRTGTPRAPVQPDDARRQRLVLYALAVSGIVGLVVVLALILLGGGGGDDGGGGGGGGDAQAVAAALERADCTLTAVPAQANASDHSDVSEPGQKIEWNTFPPTSGPHYGEQAIWGAWDDPLEQTRLVHNLEHGGVYIQYGEDVPDATVAELKAYYETRRNGTLLAPLPALGEKIALGAWVTEEEGIGERSERGRGYLATCTAFDRAAFDAFFDGLQFKGPERFSPEQMLPGT